MKDDKTNNALAERARRTMALAAGISRIYKSGAERISAYNSLLEDEWDGRPSALNFLQESNVILENILALNGGLADSLGTNLDMELLPVQPIVEGVASKQQKCSNGVLNLEADKRAFVMTDAFLLQNMLGQVAETISSDPKCIELGFSCFNTELNTNAIGILRSCLQPGEYVAISISSHPNVELFLDEYVCSDDPRLDDWCSPVANDLLYWLGVATLHQGDLMVHKSGVADGVLIMLPVSSAVTENDMRARMVGDRPETILLVDDEDMIWEVVINMLGELGYDVVLAENGKDAVEVCMANPGGIDLVILDMLMPVMNAHEAFPLLRKNVPDIKVLLASGYVDEEDVQDMLAAGACGFMRKPYRLKDLARRIRDILDKEA